MTKEALKLALEALEEIALAGMSGTGQEIDDAMTEWHARQAWKFIGIAARALTPIKEALKQEQRNVSEHSGEPVALTDAVRAEPTELIHKWRVLELIKEHATPQQRKPLTDEQIEEKFKSRWGLESWRVVGAFYKVGHRDSESAHGIKE